MTPTPPARSRALHALRHAFARAKTEAVIDKHGYLDSYTENLLPFVVPEDFEADLRAGDGNELETKFRAVHSSSALAVNCFAPFRHRPGDLRVPGIGTGFHDVCFERKCPTGLRGGRAPNLDVVLAGSDCVIGIESKLSEYLSPHRAAFSAAYMEQIRDHRREEGYFAEMLELMNEPGRYRWLDAAQLIKHAFGLAHTYGDQSVTLLYLFWEPSNPDCDAIFAEHRTEIETFRGRVAGASPNFLAMSYPDLWQAWHDNAPDWVPLHVVNLRARYEVPLT